MEIDVMQKEDVSVVAEVFRTTFNALGEHWGEASALGHIEQNFFGEANWVAKDEDVIVGFLMGFVLTREAGPELFVDSIAVLPEFQEQNIGSLLWKEAEAYVSREKLHGIRLLANPELPSFAWYQKMGFAKSGWVELYRKS